MIITSLVRIVHQADREKPGFSAAAASWTLERAFRPGRHLAVYGSLAPGRENHAKLECIRGTWSQGTIYGTLEARGWGAALGFPALRWDPRGNPVNVWVLTSPDLVRRWNWLDAFEGPEYVRRVVPVYRDRSLALLANCYLTA